MLTSIFYNNRKMSLHQKQMRFFTITLVMAAVLLSAAFIYLISL